MEAEATEIDPFAKLNGLAKRAIQRKAWSEAAQILAQKAYLALSQGCLGDAERYFNESIEFAKRYGLERLEMQQRVKRFQSLMSRDLTSRLRAQLEAELTWGIGLVELGGSLNAGSTPAYWELRGNLIQVLDHYSCAALSTYDYLLQGQTLSLDSLNGALDLAKEKALAFSLIYRAGQFKDACDQLGKQVMIDAALSKSIQDVADAARSEIVQICDSLRADLFLIAAEFEHKKGGFSTRDELLFNAEQVAKRLPEALVRVYIARSDYLLGEKDITEAIKYARRAYDECQQISSAALKGQMAAKLNELQARANSTERLSAEQLYGAGATELVAEILNGSAYPALHERRFEDALNYSVVALEHASDPNLERMVLRVRALALYELGRFNEAEADINRCISLLSAELAADYHADAEVFDTRVPEEENLYLLKAFLYAKTGCSTEAWKAAEQGRSGRLKREIGGEFPADFDSIRPWLHTKRAAVLSFGPTRWGTLVLTAGPDDTEPQSQILDFAFRDLLKGNDLNNYKILGWIPKLSAALIHPLLPRLSEITRQADVLYIIPDSALYCSAFAALTLENSPDSRMLLDLCPLAIAPSLALLIWTTSRPSLTSERNCLAVAFGEAKGINFCDDLPAVNAAPWSKRPTQLVNEAATPANVAAQATQHTVLFFSCHGNIKADKELMAASQLELAGGSLSARDVLGWNINADLVFLSACLAGRFRNEARTDVTGFVKAFMKAGARSLVAPLIKVDAELARDMSAWFFESWLAGATKAQALQAAQRKARNKARESEEYLKNQKNQWAMFWLFWDFL